MSTTPKLSTRERFLARVEAFLKRTGTAASRFGIEACNDPCFVSDLREGRKPSTDLMDRVDAYMREHGRERRAA